MVINNSEIKALTQSLDLATLRDEEIYEGACYGIRIEQRDYAVGDVLPPSRVWDENNVVDGEYLGGTSALALKHCAEPIAPKDAYTGYPGCRIYLVLGSMDQYGEDVGEVIIRDAKVVAVLK